MWSFVVIFSVFLEGVVGGQYCKQYYSEYSYLYTSYYCSGQCCGSLYDRDCCNDSTSNVVGATFGGILALVILLATCMCLAKACTKKANGGRVIHPQPQRIFVNSVSGRSQNTGAPAAFVIPLPPPYTSRPAPEYTRYDRKQTHNLGPAPFYPPEDPDRTFSPPPAYSPRIHPEQTLEEQTSNPEAQTAHAQDQTSSATEQASTSLPVKDQSFHPPPDYTNLTPLERESSSLPPVPSSGHLDATTPANVNTAALFNQADNGQTTAHSVDSNTN